jgi:putative oxidoreductase
MRIAFGVLFAIHGFQKVFGVLGGTPRSLASMSGAAGIIETFGGVLIALGAFTVPTAVLCSGEMAVAYFMVHQPRAPWPIQNGGELAAVYCIAFQFMAVRGPGRLSVDGTLRGRRSR